MTTGLPTGWTSVELKNHVYIAGRIGWRGLKRSEYTARGPLFLAVKNILPNGTIDFTETDHLSQERYDESPEIQLQSGDILLTKDGTIGKVGMVDFLPGKTTVNSSILVVRPEDELIKKRYLFYFLRGPQFQSIAHERITGSAIPHLFQKDIKELRVLIPPAAEQNRIVARLEKLSGQVDACQQRLAKILTLLKRFRQSVLAAACSGRLTADWREANPLLSARNGGEPKSGQSFENSDDLPELPEEWRWVIFGSVITELRNGVSPRPNVTPPGIPILRISATRPGRVDLADVRYMPKGDRLLPLYGLRDGDLLFTRYNGSIELLGVCGIVRSLDGRSLLYPDKLMRVRFEHDWISPHYVEIFFSAPGVHERVVAKSKSSAGQNGISGSDIKAQPFALPPLPEQREIVRRVEKLFALANRIEARFVEGRKRVDSITQSILAKAFRGELVPTEYDLARAEGRSFESAEELLARIKQNRQIAEGEKKSKSRSRRAKSPSV